MLFPTPSFLDTPDHLPNPTHFHSAVYLPTGSFFRSSCHHFSLEIMLPFEQSSVGVSPRWFSTPGLLPSRPFCGHTTTRPVFLNHSLDLGPSVFRNLYHCMYQIKSRELWLDVQGKDWFQLTCCYLSGMSFCWTAPFKTVCCSVPTHSFAFPI